MDGLLSESPLLKKTHAYDPREGSEISSTTSISVRTIGSSDDYDSDVDIEDIITGEYIDKAKP